MVKVFRPSKQTASRRVRASVDALDHSGIGVCRQHQPVLFVQGGLPGEDCDIQVTEQKRQYWRGFVRQVHTPSAQRQPPFCPHVQSCGGCQTQHLPADAMLSEKQQAVATLIDKATGCRTLPWQPSLQTQTVGYRRKARLALDATGKQLQIGLRGQGTQQVVDIHQCQILTQELQRLLSPLRELVVALKGKRYIGHISLFDGSSDGEITQVTFRVTRQLAQQDRQYMSAFAERFGCQVLLDQGHNQFEHLAGPAGDAAYPVHGCRISLEPNDFVQVNGTLNQAMVEQAIDWLAPEPGQQVWDLYAGIGNFSLPLAAQAAKVTGIEVNQAMVERARDNAAANGLTGADFEKADLSQPEFLAKRITKTDKVLLDPARAGARELMSVLAQTRPSAVLYVSCNPSTLARDLAVLLRHGWQIQKIALMDMFPFTSHTELMALVQPGS